MIFEFYGQGLVLNIKYIDQKCQKKQARSARFLADFSLYIRYLYTHKHTRPFPAQFRLKPGKIVKKYIYTV